MVPEQQQIADAILRIPQKRTQKTLIGFLYQDEILQVFQAVDLKRKEGFRDYALLHLLYDSAARASEIATLNLDYFDPKKKTLTILGKGNRFHSYSSSPSPPICFSSISENTVSPHNPHIKTGSLSINGGRNSPAMAYTAFAGSISKRPYLLNVSRISIPSIVSVIHELWICFIAAIP